MDDSKAAPQREEHKRAIVDEDECVAALSAALHTIDEEIFKAVNESLLKLIASFVPFGKLRPLCFCFHPVI